MPVGFWHRCRLATLIPMPKTPVDEDERVPLGKHDVGMSGQFWRMEAVAKPQGVEVAVHKHLRFRVLRPNPAHRVTALFWGNLVHYSLWQNCLFNRYILLKTTVGALGYGHCQTALLDKRNQKTSDRLFLLVFKIICYFKNTSWY